MRVEETEYEGNERTQGMMGKNIAELFGKEVVELICFFLYCIGEIFLWLEIDIS